MGEETVAENPQTKLEFVFQNRLSALAQQTDHDWEDRTHFSSRLKCLCFENREQSNNKKSYSTVSVPFSVQTF